MNPWLWHLAHAVFWLVVGFGLYKLGAKRAVANLSYDDLLDMLQEEHEEQVKIADRAAKMAAFTQLLSTPAAPTAPPPAGQNP